MIKPFVVQAGEIESKVLEFLDGILSEYEDVRNEDGDSVVVPILSLTMAEGAAFLLMAHVANSMAAAEETLVSRTVEGLIPGIERGINRHLCEDHHVKLQGLNMMAGETEH